VFLLGEKIKIEARETELNNMIAHR
jgi:hypothetical protein